MEVIRLTPATPVRAVLLDFDGTISTLRYGWEEVMEPLMLELIAGESAIDDELRCLVKEYIDESTGIQTIFQMKWLVETVKRYGRNSKPQDDPWVYKAEYNRRLMERVEHRKMELLTGEKSPEDFMVAGSVPFLEALHTRGVALYVASGTDDCDVKKEVAALGLTSYFETVAGAPEGVENCSKEMVMRKLISKQSGSELCVVGDGKVEIALGRESGARTLGIASDEAVGHGISSQKHRRLSKAGADAIVGDFLELEQILRFMGWCE